MKHGTWVLPFETPVDGQQLAIVLTPGGRTPSSDGSGFRGAARGVFVEKERVPLDVDAVTPYYPLYRLLALFADLVDVRILLLLRDALPSDLQYPWQVWTRFLEFCQTRGILLPLGKNAYRLRAGVPGAALASWQAEAGTRFSCEWEASVRALLGVYAHVADQFVEQMDRRRSAGGVVSALLHHNQLATLAFRAVYRHELDIARRLLNPLARVWVQEQRTNEAAQWMVRIRPFVFPGAIGKFDTIPNAASRLWRVVSRAQPTRVMLETLHAALEKNGDVPGGGGGDLGVLAAGALARVSRCRAEGDVVGLADAYRALGDLAWISGDGPMAEARYVRALDLEDQAGEADRQAETFHRLGCLARERGDFNGSDFWFNRALRVQEVSSQSSGIAKTLCSLGMNAHLRGDMRAAWALGEAARHATRSRGRSKPLAPDSVDGRR